MPTRAADIAAATERAARDAEFDTHSDRHRRTRQQGAPPPPVEVSSRRKKTPTAKAAASGTRGGRPRESDPELAELKAQNIALREQEEQRKEELSRLQREALEHQERLWAFEGGYDPDKEEPERDEEGHIIAIDQRQYEQNLKTSIYIGGVLRDSIVSGDCKSHLFDLAALDTAIAASIDRLGEQRRLDITIDQRTVFIKSDHSRCNKIPVVISDFAEDSWSAVESVCREQWAQYNYKRINISVAVKTIGTPRSADLSTSAVKRPRPALDSSPVGSPSKPPPARRTRTTALEDEVERRKADGEMTPQMEVEASLHDRWKCSNSHCNNKNNFCYVDHHAKHFVLDSSTIKTWAISTLTGTSVASIDRPPHELYVHLTDSGSANQLSRRSAVKERQEREAEDREEQKRRDREEREEDKRIEREEARENARQMQLMRQQMNSQMMMNMISSMPSRPAPSPSLPLAHPPALVVATPPLPPPPQIHVQSKQASPPLPRQPPSSPIGGDEEQDAIIDAFFSYLQRKRPGRWQLIADAQGVVERNLWTEGDLRRMSDEKDSLHDVALKLGVPHGLLMSFRVELRAFKGQYRGANALSALGAR